MSTNEDAALGGNDFIGHDASGKHLLLKVPDYEDSAPSGGGSLYQAAKDTYLNLGRGMGDPARNLPEWYAPTAPGATSQWDASGLAPDAGTTAAVSGDDLLAFFGGFVDDKRLRGAGGTFEQPTATPPNEAAARVAGQAPFSAVDATPAATAGGRNLQVTATIPDYLGWRDHTDGHRITTTRGDKIEIIGGNYKLVSLGRGQGVATYEMSGGIILDGDDAPGSVSSVTWRSCPSGDSGEFGWKVVEQVSKGNVVERFHGTKREEFYGDKLISVTGSPDEPTTSLDIGEGKAGDPETYVGETTAPAAQNSTTRDVASTAWSGGLTEVHETVDSYAYPTKWDSDGAPPPKLKRPAIYGATWAQSITEYTQVTDSFHSQEHHKGTHVSRGIFEKGYTNHTHLHGAGTYFQEVWHLMGSGGFFERFEGSYLQVFVGSSTTLGLANRFEFYLSTEEQVNVGLMLSLSLGAKLEGHFPLKGSVTLNDGDATFVKQTAAYTKTAAGLTSFGTWLGETKTALGVKWTALTTSTTAVQNNLGP